MLQKSLDLQIPLWVSDEKEENMALWIDWKPAVICCTSGNTDILLVLLSYLRYLLMVHENGLATTLYSAEPSCHVLQAD